MADEPQTQPTASEAQNDFFTKFGQFLDQQARASNLPGPKGVAKVSGWNLTLFGISISALFTTGYGYWLQARTDYTETKTNIKITADCARTAEKSCSVIAENTTVMAELLGELKASNDRDGKKIDDIHRATATRTAAPAGN